MNQTSEHNLLSMEPWAVAKVSVAMSPIPVRAPSQMATCPECLSANYNGDNEMIPGAVHRSPGICLPLRKTPENLS